MKLARLLVVALCGLAAAPAQQQISTHYVSITWTYPDGFLPPTWNVYRSDGACPANPVVITTKIASGFTKMAYDDQTVLDSHSYCYNVRAFWTDGINSSESDPSNYLTIVVPGPYLPAPTGLTGIVNLKVPVTPIK
jgi:hypothetical protein